MFLSFPDEKLTVPSFSYLKRKDNFAFTGAHVRNNNHVKAKAWVTLALLICAFDHNQHKISIM